MKPKYNKDDQSFMVNTNPSETKNIPRGRIPIELIRYKVLEIKGRRGHSNGTYKIEHLDGARQGLKEILSWRDLESSSLFQKI